MNDIFNFRRFGKYWYADIKRCIASYGWSLLTLSLGSLIIYAAVLLNNLILRGEWQAPEVYARVFPAFICAIALCFSMPVKCYGRLTKKNSGSSYILLPASVLEKWMSMLANCLIIMPLFFYVIYFGIDSLLSIADKTYGSSIISSGFVGIYYPVHLFDILIDFSKFTLVFLLGGICFKRGKTAKTFICLLAFNIILALITLPSAIDFLESTVSSAETIEESGKTIVDSMGLWDKIEAIGCTVALSVAIFFRIKTIKH